MPGAGRGGARRGARGRPGARRALLASLAALMIVLGAVLAARADVLTAPPLVEVELADAAPDLLVRSGWSAAELTDLRPGTPAYWFVDSWVVGVDGARLTVEIRKDGALMEVPNGVTLLVERCAERWEDVAGGPRCPAGRGVVARVTPQDDLVASSPVYWLDTVDSSDPSYVMVTLVIEDTPANRADSSLMGLTGTLGLGITAVEATPAPTDPPTEAPTDPPSEMPTTSPTSGPTGGPAVDPGGGGADGPTGTGVGHGAPRPGATSSGLLPTTGAGGALLLWVAGLGLLVGGVLTGASAATVAPRSPRGPRRPGLATPGGSETSVPGRTGRPPVAAPVHGRVQPGRTLMPARDLHGRPPGPPHAGGAP